MPREAAARSMTAGGLLALGSAVAFGASTPLVQRFGSGIGPFTTAGLLYAGAAVFSAVVPTQGKEAPLRRADVPRLVGVALLGAVMAPVALAWGLQRTSGVGASLLLNLEAVFTALLARVFWSEPIGRRVGAALAAMTAGGVLLVLGGRTLAELGTGPSLRTSPAIAGAVAVVGATFAWASDNALSRPLADRDPTRVVLAKAVLGALASALLGRLLGEGWPPAAPAMALGACGAIGYGASLRLYLRAQRTIGAARTGSLFAAAPFVGAGIAVAMGQPLAGLSTVLAGALCALGVWLHITEHHRHAHAHEAVEHEHPHRHDDGHHAHEHETYPSGEHSHLHRHEPLAHVHAHGLDVHHRHRH